MKKFEIPEIKIGKFDTEKVVCLSALPGEGVYGDKDSIMEGLNLSSTEPLVMQ